MRPFGFMDLNVFLPLPALQKRLQKGEARVLKGGNPGGWDSEQPVDISARKPAIGSAGPQNGSKGGGQRQTRRSERG